MLRLFNLDSTYSHRQKFIGSLIKIDVSNVLDVHMSCVCMRLSLFLRCCCCCCWIIVVACLLLRALNTLSHSNLTLQLSVHACVFLCVSVYIHAVSIQQTTTRMCLSAVCSNKWLNGISLIQSLRSLVQFPFSRHKTAHMCAHICDAVLLLCHL